MPRSQFAEKPKLPRQVGALGEPPPALLLCCSAVRPAGSRPGPTTRSDERHTDESWSAHPVNSDLRGSPLALLCCSCRAALARHSCPAAATETLKGFIWDTTCSAFRVVVVKWEGKVTHLTDASFCWHRLAEDFEGEISIMETSNL